MFKPIKVIDLELSRPLSDLHDLADYQAVKALVRLHGAPIGYVQVPVMGGSCTAMALGAAVFDQHARAILRQLVEDSLTTAEGRALCVDDLPKVAHPVYQGPFPLVTVAVCTRNRTTDLASCLESLVGLNYPNLEILVVDNAPTDNTTEQLISQAYPQVKYVCEPRPGLDWARNRAILEAHGEIIAYTDDDVIVDANWVMAIAQLLAENPEVMAVTGLVAPYELETPTQVLFEEYGGFGRGFSPQWYTADQTDGEPVTNRYAWAGRFGTGANMAYRRCLFDKVGPFDPALDVGTPTNGGGDIEMFFRVLCAGYTLVYEPKAVVRHRHRREYAKLYSQLANNGVGFSAYLVRSALAHPGERFAILRFWFAWLCSWHLPRLWKSFRGRESFPRELIVAEFTGYLVGLGRYPQARAQVAQLEREFGLQYSGETAKGVPVR